MIKLSKKTRKTQFECANATTSSPKKGTNLDDSKQHLIQPVLTPEYFMNLQKMQKVSPDAYILPAFHPMNLPQDREVNEIPMTVDEKDHHDHNRFKRQHSFNDPYENQQSQQNEESNV
ncbi:hypothetical protein M3Y97_00756300 [Aphelenchoides bicaudatus]|nr:hypothetical protein M3Y97_00756300 [Aphelenchoides bicaudatus]